MSLIVQKFGGSSVRDVERLKNVARLVIAERERGNDVVVGVSAMGKTTDDLVRLAHEITDNPDAREMDMLLASGEQVSIAALAIAIHHMGHGAVSFTGPQVGIKTDGVFGRARIVHINDAKIRRAFDENKIVIVAGFQGVSANEEITTLGRGGSDTTAVALAAALKAERCDIYTDVDGVYTADPRDVPDARRLDRITFDEMLELASLGAKVLHSRSVELAMNHGVPLRVLSSLAPGPGTLVLEDYEQMEDFIVRAVTADRDQSKFSIIGVPDEPGIAADVFDRLGKANISVDMIIQNVGSNGRNDISFTVAKNDFRATSAIANQLKGDLGAAEIQIEEDIAKLSAVGVGMKSHSGVAAKIFRAMAGAGINIKMVSTSEICVSCLIDLKDAEAALRAVHAEFDLAHDPASA